MQLPYSDELEIQYLSRLFDNTSECYKFFWFQAIVTKVLEGKNILTYEELIDEMIADAGCGSGRDSKVFLYKGFAVTAMDASGKMCTEAAKLLHQEVLRLSFEEMSFQNEFDGIWACASLLHVAKKEINTVMMNLKNALKPKGVLYVSFKYGTEERIAQGRLFNDYDESSLTEVLKDNGFTVCDVFVTEDVRAIRQGEKWVNAIAKLK